MPVRNIDIIKNKAAAKRFLRQFLFDKSDEALQRAADILVEEYEKFFRQAEDNGHTKVFADAQVEMEVEDDGDKITNIRVFVPDEGGGGNLIFHVLDNGTKALGAAADYGLKAWPMAFPRNPDFGNSPMTQPGSPELSPAFSIEPLVFRPVINNPIKPRKFTKSILDKAKARWKSEGIDSFLRIKIEVQE